jgi:hypothetical protein
MFTFLPYAVAVAEPVVYAVAEAVVFAVVGV